MAPRAGVPGANGVNGLDCQTAVTAHTDTKSVFGTVSNLPGAALAAQTLGMAGRAVYEVINVCSDLDQLDEMGRLLWKGYGEGSIGEGEATYLSSLIERRRPLGYRTAPGHTKPLGKVAGRLHGRFTSRQRQRSPDRRASRDRRRTLGGSSALPDNLRHHYTEGQRAVLCIVAGEVKHHGICDLPIDKTAALAGVCRTTVQTTLHEARRLGHITITERPQPGRKSLTNIVQINSPEWRAWLRRGPSAYRPTGSKIVKMVSTTKNTDLRKKGATDEKGTGQATGHPDVLPSGTWQGLDHSKPARVPRLAVHH
jgi:hypothetical protein